MSSDKDSKKEGIIPAKANYIPPDQFQLMLDNVELLNAYVLPPDDIRMLFKCTRYLGLRISNALRLKAEDFNIPEKQVWIGKTKTQDRFWASIPPAFIPELEPYLQRKKGLLFPTNRKTVDKWLRKLGKLLEIPALTTPQSITHEKTKCHIFRKSIGKDMMYQGKSLNQIQRKLGHAKATTTAEYLKINLEDLKEAEIDLKLN